MVKRTGAEAGETIHVLYSLLEPRKLQSLLGKALRANHDRITRTICNKESSVSLEPKLVKAVQSMSSNNRAHLLPALNVILNDQLVIKDGKVVPEGERCSVTKQQFNSIVGKISEIFVFLPLLSNCTSLQAKCTSFNT
jgi:hypothetical protein